MTPFFSFKTLCLFGLAGSLLVSAPVFAERKIVPIDAFVKRDQFNNPRLSPDGKYVAINVRILRNGRMVPTLTVYSLPDLQVVSSMIMPRFEIPLNFTWATNTRLIVTKGIELGLREPPASTGEVIAVDFDGKRFEYLYGYDNFKSSTKGERYGSDYGFGSIEQIPQERNGHVVIGSYLGRVDRSYLYDIDSVKATRKLVADVPAKYLDFSIQNNGMPRFASGIDDDDNAVLYRRDDAGQWLKQGPEVIGKRFVPLGYTADDSEFYAFVSARGEPAALVRESLKNGQRTVVSKDEHSSLSVQWGERGLPPFAVLSHIAVPTVRYLDEKSPNAKLHKALSEQFPGYVVNFINFTDDGNKLLFGVGSDRDPGSYYLWDKKTGNADLLFTTSADIDPDLMATRRPFRFKARDGVEIYGFLTMPVDADPAKQKVPMVLMPHGGPFDVADSWYYDDEAQFLANRGYAVLQVNFRGSGNRGKGFEESGYLQWGKKIQDDLIDGVKAAIAKEGIDPKRICTYGVSFGGYAALMLPIREPDMFQCAVGFAGAYDLAYKYKEDRLVYSKSTKAFFKRTMGTDEAELAQQSPAKLADKLKIPVWLVHGGKDETVTIEHAKRMREALVKAGRPPEWTVEPDEGHGFFDEQRRKAFLEKLEAWLAKHIGKPG